MRNLATVELDLTEKRKTITIPLPDGTAPRSRGIRIRASKGNVVITRVTVTYATGERHYEERRIVLNEAERTRIIDQGEDTGRVVNAVTIEIETVAAGGKVTLDILSNEVPPNPLEGFGPRSVGDPDAKKYSEVQLYYGTTRQLDPEPRIKNDRTIASFTGERGPSMTLGRAVVTLPTNRKDNLPRPEIDLVVLRFALRKEDPAKDITIDAIDVLDRTDFVASMRKRAMSAVDFRGQAFVFIHGYNVGFDDALFRTAQLTHDMRFDGVPVAFSWPSRGGVTDYPYDREMAVPSATALIELLELVAAQPEITHVNIIAHSMGNQPTLRALSQRARDSRLGVKLSPLKLTELMLAAPDVSRSDFEELTRELKPIVSGGITLYASSKDKALVISRRFQGGLIRAGDVPTAGPVFVAGVDSIDISDAAGSVFGLNHNTFAERKELIDDMNLLLKSAATGARQPPDKRTTNFVPVSNGGRAYWKFRP